MKAYQLVMNDCEIEGTIEFELQQLGFDLAEYEHTEALATHVYDALDVDYVMTEAQLLETVKQAVSEFVKR